MKYQIRITKNSEQDIYDTIRYIDYILKNPDAADNLLKQIEKISHLLEEFPKKFPLVDDPFLKPLGIRSVSVKNYLLFYIISEKEQTVYLVRFLFSKSDWKSILKNK